MMRLAAAVAVVLATALTTVQSAAAAVTIGQLPAGPPAASCPSGDYLQPSVTSGSLYIAKAAGTVTSWSTVAAAGMNQHYTLKVFRRTGDPDAFQVLSHGIEETLPGGAGLTTFATNLAVSSGDLIGLNVSGSTACTFSTSGDTVLTRPGNLVDGAQGVFGTTVPNSRLNLSAVLNPTNSFTLGDITRDLTRGTATVTAKLSNPGTIVLSGNGLKGDKTKTIFVAGPVTFTIATTGKVKRKLLRRGRVFVRPNFTFLPAGGDPSSRSIKLKLKRTLVRG
jgi:hypothetical protein